MRNKKKAGFSIVEVIVSITIIVIVSISAITIFQSSGDTMVRSVRREKAISTLNNGLEIFKYYDNEEEFKTELRFNYNEETGVYYQYQDGFLIEIDVDYSTESASVFSGKCRQNGKVIFEIENYARAK